MPVPTPDSAPSAEEQPTAPTEAATETVQDALAYPRVLAKGDLQRTVPDHAEEVRLRFEGWRPVGEDAPARGGFLPAPTTSAPAEQTSTTRRRKS